MVTKMVVLLESLKVASTADYLALNLVEKKELPMADS